MNKALAILHIYPNADPVDDFKVQDNGDGNGSFIALWNLETPQPTESQLLVAWKGYLAAEATKPHVLTQDQKIAAFEDENLNLMLAIAEVYEEKEAEKAVTQEESINTMLAITEIYELMTGGN